MKISLISAFLIIATFLACTKETEPEIEPTFICEEVILNDTFQHNPYLPPFEADIDGDGEMDISFSYWSNGGPYSFWSESGYKARTIDSIVKIAIEQKTSYVCLDTLYDYQGSGYDGTLLHTCQDTSVNIVEVIETENVKVFLSPDDILPSEEFFDSNISSIRWGESASGFDPFPGFVYVSKGFGSEEFNLPGTKYLLYKKEDCYFLLEFKKENYNYIFVRTFPI